MVQGGDMAADELMSISRFAHLSGVTVHMLRHYDEIGILTPAAVDIGSGYRRYHLDQTRLARLIRWLRGCAVPIDIIKQVLVADAANDNVTVEDLLRRHKGRLTRQRDRQSAWINDVNRFLERGLPMDTIRPGCHPVQIKLSVENHGDGVAFYRDALGLPYQVARRTASADRSAFMFGDYAQSDFFLIWLVDEPGRLDRPGRSNVGFLVDDVDTVHRRALNGGATEMIGPRDEDSMPRHSAVTDPWGNWIQLVGGDITPRPVRLVVAVDDVEAAGAFYQQAFGLDEDSTRTADHESLTFAFGNTEAHDVFQLVLCEDRGRVDQPGRSTFSFLVDHLDTVHRRAIAAGATEVTAPRDAEGMPRGSGVTDPFGNMIGLAQA